MWKSKITVAVMTLAGIMPAQRPLALQAAAGRQMNENPYEEGQEEVQKHENWMCALNKAVLLYKQKGALDTLAQGFCIFCA